MAPRPNSDTIWYRPTCCTCNNFIFIPQEPSGTIFGGGYIHEHRAILAAGIRPGDGEYQKDAGPNSEEQTGVQAGPEINVDGKAGEPHRRDVRLAAVDIDFGSG